MNLAVRLGAAALVLAALILTAATALVLPSARGAARRVRCRVSRWRRRVPGLPDDGEPLSGEDLHAFMQIMRGWQHTAREPERSP